MSATAAKSCPSYSNERERHQVRVVPMFTRIQYYKVMLRLIMYAAPILAFAAAMGFRFRFGLFRINSYNTGHYEFGLALYAVVWALVAEKLEMTDPAVLARIPSALRRILAAVAIASACQFAVLFFAKVVPFSRVFFALTMTCTALFSGCAAILFRWYVQRFASNAPSRVLVVGADRFASRAATNLRTAALPPCRIIGYVRLNGQAAVADGTPIYTPAEVIAGDIPFDEVVVATGPECLSAGAVAIQQLKRMSRPIRAIIDFGDGCIFQRAFALNDMQVFNVGSHHPETLQYLVLKRIFDVAFSLAVLIGLGPVFIIIAAAVKLSSPGPILFRQQRVGLNGEVFDMYKFRTMRVAAITESDTAWTTAEDPRKTRIGAFLRKTSLDELPQFLNVLKGNMSVVGPRPERPYFVGKFLDEIDDYDIRHRLKVGITGWAQVNGWRGDTSIARRIEFDLYYLQNWSFSLDLLIVARTVFSGLIDKNAY